MPTAFELARSWDEAGELEQEFQELERILKERHFIQRKIVQCFEGLIGPFCVRTWKKLGHRPTIQEFRTEIGNYFRDTTKTLEICLSISDSRERTEVEAWQDALRMLENQLWNAAARDDGQTESE